MVGPFRATRVEARRPSLPRRGGTIAWYGVWLFADWLGDRRVEDEQAMLRVELEASRHDPYRRLSRVFHLVGRSRRPTTATDRRRSTSSGARVRPVSARPALVLFLLALVVVIVGADVALFRHHFWARLLANVGIVLVFLALYLRFQASFGHR